MKMAGPETVNLLHLAQLEVHILRTFRMLSETGKTVKRSTHTQLAGMAIVWSPRQ